MDNGTVKFYNSLKKYGFIISDNGQEVFFHLNDVINGRLLESGNIVSFEIENTTKGLCAREVRFLKIAKYSDEE